MDKDFLMAMGIDEDIAHEIVEKHLEEVDEFKLKTERENESQILELNNQLSLMESTHNEDIRKFKIDSAIDLEILKARGKNPKAIKALIDYDNIDFDDDGNINGIDMEKLMESDGYLFENATTERMGIGFKKGENLLINDEINSQVAKAMGVKF